MHGEQHEVACMATAGGGMHGETPPGAGLVQGRQAMQQAAMRVTASAGSDRVLHLQSTACFHWHIRTVASYNGGGGWVAMSAWRLVGVKLQQSSAKQMPGTSNATLWLI